MAAQICESCRKKNEHCYCSPNSVCNEYEPEEKNKVLEFINRRFLKDCNWVTGNCYYFSVILKDRFPEGKIFYDVIYGHFIFQYENQFYDWTGICNLIDRKLVPWDEFEKYDHLQKERIIAYCIM